MKDELVSTDSENNQAGHAWYHVVGGLFKAEQVWRLFSPQIELILTGLDMFKGSLFLCPPPLNLHQS